MRRDLAIADEPVVGVSFRRTLGAAVVGALLLMTPACSSGPEGGLTLLGDSITILIGGATEAKLAGYTSTRVKALWGARIDEQLAEAADIAKRRPDQVIVNLGTNNILQDRPLDASIAEYRQILDAFSDLHCVGVITINEHISQLGVDRSAAAIEFNAALRALAADYPNTTVTEWSSIFVFPQDQVLLDSDTVHPLPDGVERLASTYEAIARACEVPEPSSD